MSLNKCMIIGNLGRDPEMRYTPGGQAVTQFSVATNRNFRDPQGEWQSETEWFRVVVWAEQAERAAEQLRKGHKVYVEGRLQTRQWEDQSGNKRYTTELVANRVQSLERRDREDGPPPPSGEPGGGASNAGSGYEGGASPSPGSSAQDFDDLPF
ncbi:MAG TPA: single-stranded DNA-binding protein [Candidatus Limnocylindrales bacterium]|nr:single-stranded DNA-binding protein [Candidatus Limnocylindrales bacterium]